MPAAPRVSRIDLAALAFGPVAVALLALALGQSTSWDLRNYHWYNAYALLEGRMGFDMAVAHHATFYNPLIDLPLWWVAQVAPGWLAAMLLGAVQGLNFSLLYLLARDTLRLRAPWLRVACFVLALIGITGGYALTLTGSPHYDNVVSVLVLWALWLIVRRRDAIANGGGRAALVGAGLLVGAAVGLKLPTAPFGLAILAAALAACVGWRARAVALPWCGGAAFLAFAATTGWWFFVLWRETGNPVFPYFNDIIGSTLILDASYRDTRFLPNSFGDALLFPFRASLDWRVSADGPLTDWRIAFAYALVPPGALALLWRARRSATRGHDATSPSPRHPGERRDPAPFAPKNTGQGHWIPASAAMSDGGIVREDGTQLASPHATRILFWFATVGYTSWLAVFAIYRYLTPLEMLAPLLIAAAVFAFPLPPAWRIGGAIAALLGVLVLTPRPHDPRPPFADRVVTVDVPAIARPDATLALMTGVEPMAFVIPHFPPRIPFLRIDGYLVGPGAETPYLRTMRERIDAGFASGDDVFVLFLDFERPRTDEALQQLQLRRSGDCTAITHNLGEPLQWCRVLRDGD